MPKPYVLKRNLISKETLDRLFKTYIEGVKSDKVKAKNLYDRAIALLDIASESVLNGTSEDGADLILALKALETTIKAQSNESSVNRSIKHVLELIREFIEKPVKDPKNVNSETASDVSKLFDDISKELKDNGEED